ncbi:RNA exonuclease 3 [Kalmusia sp. IMI 367209]|nr:RNA exonuclease 3 [Kalmusia sp. IMI 367209]
MWPASFSIFANQGCPEGNSCEIPNCLFSHKEKSTSQHTLAVAHSQPSANGQPPAKRLRLDHDADQPTAQPNKVLSEAVETPVFTGLRTSTPIPTPPKQEVITDSVPGQALTNGKTNNALPRTATKPVSPPPKKVSTEVAPKPEVEVRLLPRKVQSEPAPFATRLVRLKALHEFMTPLNNKVATAIKPSTKALHLTANQLRSLAVDEEEKVARENPVVYDNVIKHRMAAYKKMTIEEWVKIRREATVKDNGEPPKKPPLKKVETGMTLKQEVTFLSTLFAPEASLEAHGFVTKMPTDAEVEECKKTQMMSDCWEVCDRCGTRFQAFPERREQDGALTAGGKCQHHWGKKMWPRRSKGEETEPAKYSCCNAPVGSPGCTVNDTHVYKFTDVNRMSLVMPFVETPTNDEVEPQTAVCFDCEMGYTTQGFELLRLTVVSWPSHKPVIDVLVRPLGYILDLNTQWSGVTMDQFLNAKPHDPENPKPKRTELRIVESPYVARDLFLKHVSRDTPVLGHALENDLNVIRLIHPTIVDTVILYPTRSGLPYRHSLKTLAKQHLGLDVQQGGASGHDSYEDARTTGELIRFTVAQKWKRLKEEGWAIRDDGVYPPLPTDLPPPTAPAAPSMIATPKMASTNGDTAEKRKHDRDEGGGKDSIDEPPHKK